MKFLLTADLHLTAREIDAYRWSIFKWLRVQGQNRGVDAFLIAGDLTDAKDNHGAALVNKLVLELRRLAAIAPVYAVSGNHDYADPSLPFFSFLQELEGVRFYTQPEVVRTHGLDFAFLPHTDRPVKAWGKRIDPRYAKADFVILHQPLKGAVGENGRKLEEGLSPAYFDACRGQVFSGDVHTPQELGKVTYVGAPHPVRFGDDYGARVLYYDGQEVRPLRRTTLRKVIARVSAPQELMGYGLTEGDMVRVEYHLRRSEYADWPDTRRQVVAACKDLGVRLCGLEATPAEEEVEEGRKVAAKGTPAAVLRQYCKDKGIDKPLRKLGARLLKGDGL